MAKRLTLILIVAIVFILTFHKALADGGDDKNRADKKAEKKDDLVAITAMPYKAANAPAVDCKTAGGSGTAVQKRILADGETVAAFAHQVSGAYTDWYQKLASHEGQDHNWPERFFDNVATGAKTLDRASSDLYSIGTEYEALIAKLKETVQTCYVDNSKRAHVLGEIDSLAPTLSESQGAAADFVSQMQGHTADWAKKWRAFENKSTRVPRDYFKAVDVDANGFEQASALLKDDAEMVAQMLDPIVSEMAELTFRTPELMPISVIVH